MTAKEPQKKHLLNLIDALSHLANDQIPSACAEKMKLSEPQSGPILRVSIQNVIRMCYSSVCEIHEPVQENAL